MNQLALVVDGPWLVHSTFRALRHRLDTLKARTRLPAAVWGRLARADQAWRPIVAAICWEGPGEPLRRQLMPSYKAHRPRVTAIRAPDRLPFESFVAPVGLEADDAIAALTVSAVAAGWCVRIMAADKDLAALVGDRVDMCAGPGQPVVDRAAVERRWGVSPALLPWLLAVMGDRSDGVPGVPGCGRVRALRIVRDGRQQVYHQAVAAHEVIRLRSEAVRVPGWWPKP